MSEVERAAHIESTSRDEPSPLPAILAEVIAERARQIGKGYDASHDDMYGNGELGRAAAYYAAHGAVLTFAEAPHHDLLRALGVMWPWDQRFLKPRSHRENLIRAAALIVAEIERVDREAKAEGAAS